MFFLAVVLDLLQQNEVFGAYYGQTSTSILMDIDRHYEKHTIFLACLIFRKYLIVNRCMTTVKI